MADPQEKAASSSISHVENCPADPPIDPSLEKKLLWKVDLRLVPPLAFLYLLAFLDRINIGNARIQGLEESLNMDPEGSQYNIALFVFFITYVLFEIPSNMLLKRFAPSTWLSVITCGFGICSMCQGLVRNWAGLVICRVFLGVAEAGLLPGTIYLMSMYYKRHEFQRRFGIWYVSVPLAGAFGGLLAYALAHMDGIGGYEGWRWIFIIEGIVTVVGGVGVKFWLADWPHQAKFLSEAERVLVQRRISEDTGPGAMDTLDKRALRLIFTDYKIYIGALLYFAIALSGNAVAYFTPTILHHFGYSSLSAQVHSIPIWMVAAVTCVVAGIASDLCRHRYWFIMAGCATTIAGYAILISQSPPGRHRLPMGVQYFALFLVFIGIQIVQPITLGWLSGNLAGHYKRAFGSAIQVSLGNLAGLVASNIFLTSEAPTFVTGFATCFALLVLHALLSSLLAYLMKRENARRDRGERDYRFELPEEQLNNMGDCHPSYRFGI
ncbi:major facilitator superfamily domain-containing protein [Aspergillus insuetus]